MDIMQSYKLYSDGKLKEASSQKYFDAVNPSTGEIFARVSDASLDDMKSAIISARNAFDKGDWSSMSVFERGIYLKAISKSILDNAKELADLECVNTGKTIKQTTFIDVPTAAETFEYFGNLSNQLDDTFNQINAPVKSITTRESIGVVAATIPWNYPLIMAAWKIAPALIAGNCVILKPSSKSCVSIMKLAELISKVGLPSGILNVISSSDHLVASELASSLLVDKFSFTGGTTTGQKVMKMAASNTKRLTLELGGKSPNIVCSDCDFDAAIGGTMSAIFMNQGQMCTAGSRLIIEESIYDKFVKELINKTKKLKIGNAQSHDTDFGPLNNVKHRDDVLTFIEKGLSEGAKLLCGGKIPEGDNFKSGAYIEPTILGDVNNLMTIAQEEVFGPVLCVMKFSILDDAIKIANDSKFGLASCIWTKDLDKANKIAKMLQCGTVWINTYGGFYNEAPFGGYKQSGFGRELGLEGLLEYTQTKHICIDQTPGGKPLVSCWF